MTHAIVKLEALPQAMIPKIMQAGWPIITAVRAEFGAAVLSDGSKCVWTPDRRRITMTSLRDGGFIVSQAKAADPECPWRLTCCCCGAFAGRWVQFSNRDTGFGICKPCIERIRVHKPFGHEPMSEEEIVRTYGVEGVNWGAV